MSSMFICWIFMSSGGPRSLSACEQETELPEQEAKKREHDSQPYPSPTHAGGLFAINRHN